MPSSGGVGIDVVGVVVRSGVVEVDADVVEWVLFFFRRPLALAVIFKTNIYI